MNFLYVWQLIAFALGLLVILLIKRQYPRFRTRELVLIIVLYAVLVILFSGPVINLIKRSVG